MKLRHHIFFAALCIALWATYYILGIPYNYFQDLNPDVMLPLLLTTFLGVIPVFTVLALAWIRVPFLRASVWLALYASAPLFILDLVFVGIIKGEGLHFLVSHWYLTLGYAAVWIEIPFIGKSLEKLSLKIINQNI